MMNYNFSQRFATGASQCPSGPLYGSPAYPMVVDAIKGKVGNIRFPGGTSSRSFNNDLTGFAKLCADTGAKCTYVVQVSDWRQSLLNAIELRKQGVEITLFEFGNEEYDHQSATDKKDQWNLNMNPRGWYHDRGRAYGNTYNAARSAFKGYFNVPFIASVQMPNDAKNGGWWDGLHKVARPDGYAVHFYHSFGDKDWYGQTVRFIPLIRQRGPVYATEHNVKYEPGGYQDLAYGPDHLEILRDDWAHYESMGVKELYLHSLWGHNLFERFSYRDGVFKDNYKGWIL